MKRSDLILAIAKAKNTEDLNKLVKVLHSKIEAVYSLVFALEKYDDSHEPLSVKKTFDSLTEKIREALES